MDSGQSVTFIHSNEMLRHALWLFISWLGFRNYKIVHKDDLKAAIGEVEK